MSRNGFIGLAIAFVLSGCTLSFQGIKVRAEAPGTEEAYRLLAAAANAEGFTVRTVDPFRHSFETAWRDLRETEADPQDGRRMQGKITVRVEARGLHSDVFITPRIRGAQDSLSIGDVAPPTHPFRMRWQRVVRTVVTVESKEEE
jgi:hypothetical protein